MRAQRQNWLVGELGPKKKPKKTPPRSFELPKLSELPGLPTTQLLAFIALISASIHACTVIKTNREETLTRQPLTEEIVDEIGTDMLPLGKPDSNFDENTLSHVIRTTTYRETGDPSRIMRRFVQTFIRAYGGNPRKSYYYDTHGNILNERDYPAGWESLSKEKKQTWHDQNRRELLGNNAIIPENSELSSYPFVGTAGIPSENGKTLSSRVELARENLSARISDKRYFNGEEMTVAEGIERITTAYGIPLELALGFGMNESLFDQDAKSSADAHGIYQFLPGTFKLAKRYVNKHPEFGSQIRTGEVGNFESEWQNRFVQTELFCAYFKQTEENMHPSLLLLEKRLSTIDLSFSSTMFTEIAAISAYNAGPERIRRCIERFAGLSDNEIKKHIGNPPYELDIWLGILGHSMGEDRVGTDVFQYVPGTLATGAILAGKTESEFLDTYAKREKTPKPTEQTVETETSILPKTASGILTILATALAMGITAIRKTTKKALKITVMALPLAIAAIPHFTDKEKHPTESTRPSYEEIEITHETYPEVVEKAKEILDQTGERTKGANWGTEAQLQQLIDNFESALGQEFVADFRRSIGRKKSMYERGQAAQDKYLERAKKSGVLISIPENDPKFPIFCEQVGYWEGTQNNPNSLYMRREFVPIMGTLIALVNDQIDRFNENPAKYGYTDFPKIPHIMAIKTSGAFRRFDQTYEGLIQGYPTTPNLPPHSLGTALDIGSYGTDNSHMVRFAGAMYDREGNLQIKPGDLLPSQGFGANTRPILLAMIGRALIAMAEPMKEETGITIMPLWEPTQLNWHVAIDPPRE
ncbi:MAG: hypothetical protein UV80_C0008G0001 [Candidatus Peregrinibacteria bacterium GW2011_GWF2_43_17]|nr:MAG: hypothetical protein UV80_C0008G0001 [Candidatus Peregrinibacteria bacterium GW2011_GWF2_43_17]